ncbi:MAG: glycoside hydrolase 15-related protein [Herbinix sp.]|jgi:oligosaccharide amylase|nr:glycoside hydrolase 15-related protein [Herbinix sp.]
MAKAYINDGIIGNSRMLGCLTREGELHRLFWPNIDHMQHIDKFEVGVIAGDDNTGALFLTNQEFRINQFYSKGTNVLNTMYSNDEIGLKILQSDFCLIGKDILIRQYEIENTYEKEQVVRWILHSSSVSSTSNFTGSLINFDQEALIHYQRDQYMSISSDMDIESFQLGGDIQASLKKGKLQNSDSVLMVSEGALSWNLGNIEAKGKKSITIQICFAHNYKKLEEVLTEARKAEGKILYQQTKDYWLEYSKRCGVDRSKNQQYNDLYERTLLVFKLMYDEKCGGLMAAPEVDEEMEKCGRYAYCWGRDAAFIADALDQCGLEEEVEQFFYYAKSIQEENGSWFQRYCMDGNLAPSWGLQIDETGSLLYGMWKHYDRTNNITFLKNIWENVKLGADFLINFMDPETGLTKASHDLWEERWGEHTYSAAAVYAGLRSSIKIAKCLEVSDEISNRWETTAIRLKAAIENELWEEDHNCFLRGIRTQLYPAQKMKDLECRLVPANSKGAMKEVVCKDYIVDVSLIGLSVPFGVLEASDYRMIATVKKIEDILTVEKVGGIKRYEDDEYIGGNPWILTTLWLALYHIKNKDFNKALLYFDWAVKGRTELDLLPEQISKETGEPIWIVPLTWSHAMYALVYHELRKENII